jgi:hypothetical protein
MNDLISDGGLGERNRKYLNSTTFNKRSGSGNNLNSNQNLNVKVNINPAAGNTKSKIQKIYI